MEKLHNEAEIGAWESANDFRMQETYYKEGGKFYVKRKGGNLQVPDELVAELLQFHRSYELNFLAMSSNEIVLFLEESPLCIKGEASSYITNYEDDLWLAVRQLRVMKPELVFKTCRLVNGLPCLEDICIIFDPPLSKGAERNNV